MAKIFVVIGSNHDIAAFPTYAEAYEYVYGEALCDLTILESYECEYGEFADEDEEETIPSFEDWVRENIGEWVWGSVCDMDDGWGYVIQEVEFYK